MLQLLRFKSHLHFEVSRENETQVEDLLKLQGALTHRISDVDWISKWLDVRELDVIEQARVRCVRLNHLEGGSVLVNLGTTRWLKLGHGLQQHEPCKATRADPVAVLHFDDNLVALLEVFALIDFLMRELWQLRFLS